MLKKLGVSCNEAHSGIEAIDMYSQHYCKLMFMDINIPIMDGLECGTQQTYSKMHATPYCQEEH